MPLNKLVFKDSGDPQKSTISLFRFSVFVVVVVVVVFLSGCIFTPEAV